MCTWGGFFFFGTHPLARHVSSQKTLEDIVLPEHGKENWYRDTATTTMLTRGNTTLWGSVAVTATGLSLTVPTPD